MNSRKEKTKKNPLKEWIKKKKKKLAATYSPADEPQYHRRESVLLPCSGWERVFPRCHGHQQTNGRRTGVCILWSGGRWKDNMAKPHG